jgi:hypothetical protein
MSGNRELLRKADLTISELIANGGYLQPEDSAVFLRKLIYEPTILRSARVVEMLAPQRKINKIGFGSRIMQAAVSQTALSQEQRAQPTTSVIELNTQEIMATVYLPYEVVEDNIERATAADNAPPNSRGPGGLKETILALIAERAALDLEELCLLGNTNYAAGPMLQGSDADTIAYMSLFNGWLNLSQGGHVYDAQNANLDKSIFRNLKINMPKQYLRVLPQMSYLTSPNIETMWRDSLANRGTALGDATLTGTAPVPAYGIPLLSGALMPDNQILLTNPKNLIVGIQRQFSLEFDKDIQARTYIIVLTARVAVQVEETDATALAINVALGD